MNNRTEPSTPLSRSPSSIETTELHFALGSLFRRRGEMERAIRVHQSLLNRSDLPSAEREHAQRNWGLPEGRHARSRRERFRAAQDTRYALPALRSLIRIYESGTIGRAPSRAVKTLHGLVDEPVPQIVHYYCEQAQTALQAKPADLDAAHVALRSRRSCVDDRRHGRHEQGTKVRTAMLHARVALLEQDPKRERLYLESVMTDAPEYAGLVAEQVLANYRAAGHGGWTAVQPVRAARLAGSVQCDLP